VTRRRGIPVTSVVLTLVDLSARLPSRQLEAAINEADAHALVNPEALRPRLETYAGGRASRPYARCSTAALSCSPTPIWSAFSSANAKAGLPTPQTRLYVNGFKVDFYWPDLGLVVETNSLRYHRAPAQQARDRLRDQAHARAGLTPLRFTHAQVRLEADHALAVLSASVGVFAASNRIAGPMPAHDVLIIGAGLAGQRAALAAAEAGASVAVMSKVHPVRSHSNAAAGGINAALNPEDTWESHAFDTVKGSDYLGDQDAIEIMCARRPDEILHLEHLGVTFHRSWKQGEYVHAHGAWLLGMVASIVNRGLIDEEFFFESTGSSGSCGNR